MYAVATTREKLSQFFATHPHHRARIIREPNSVEIWEEIFIYFFGEFPIDNVDSPPPSYWRKGSSDPRWDTLLSKRAYGALQAMNSLLEEFTTQSDTTPSCKEAA